MPYEWGYRPFMAGKPTFKRFLAALNAHWLDAMSGSASVPFAIWAAFAGEPYQRLILAVAAAACLVFAAYRVWAAERRARVLAEGRVGELEAEYVRALNLAAVNLGDQRQAGKPKTKIIKRDIQFVLQWENTISRPIDYQFSRIVIEGKVTNTGPRCSAGGHAKPLFYTEQVPGKIPPSDPEQYTIELEYVYGEPGKPSRSAKKTIVYTAHIASGRVAWVYTKDEDEPCP